MAGDVFRLQRKVMLSTLEYDFQFNFDVSLEFLLCSWMRRLIMCFTNITFVFYCSIFLLSLRAGKISKQKSPVISLCLPLNPYIGKSEKCTQVPKDLNTQENIE